jgi:hypothetical protein
VETPTITNERRDRISSSEEMTYQWISQHLGLVKTTRRLKKVKRQKYQRIDTAVSVATLAIFANEEGSERRDQVRRRRRLAAVSTKTVVQRGYSFLRI